jgi:hypothetical protein
LGENQGPENLGVEKRDSRRHGLENLAEPQRSLVRKPPLMGGLGNSPRGAVQPGGGGEADEHESTGAGQAEMDTDNFRRADSIKMLDKA